MQPESARDELALAGRKPNTPKTDSRKIEDITLKKHRFGKRCKARSARHAARSGTARATCDADVVAALRLAQSLQVTMTLAGDATVIRFVQVHLKDLRAIISVTNGMRPSPAGVNDGCAAP